MYAIALDLASLMTNMACAFRPIIYLICQPTLRQEVFKVIKKMCSPTTKKSDGNNNHSTLVTDIMYTQVRKLITCHTMNFGLNFGGNFDPFLTVYVIY